MEKVKLFSFIKVLTKTDFDLVLNSFLVLDIIILSGFIGSSAKLTVFFLFIILFLINLRIKNLIISSFLVAVYTFQFYVPNKYYVVEVLKSAELMPNSGNYLLSYGLNLENIFIFLSAFLIIRNIVLRKHVLNVPSLKFILPVIISAILYFAVSLYSVIFNSPFSNLSFVWLLQYMQLFIVGLSLVYIYVTYGRKFSLVIPVICASVIFQSIVGLLQFIRQSWIGIPVESFRANSTYYGAVDAVDSIFRVAGTFGHPNQFAIIILSMNVILLTASINLKKPILILATAGGVLSILLTQSRSAWIALFMVSLMSLIFYKEKYLKFIKYLGLRRTLIYIFIISVIASIVVIPRTLRSFNLLSNGGSVPLRVAMLKEANWAIAVNPWVGYGIGTNEITLFRFFPNGYNYSFPAPVHNGYIQIILESGILGFTFLVFPFLYLTRKILLNLFIKLKQKNRDYKDYSFVALSGIVSFSVFYIFLPHEGIREFAYLGIILGYAMIALYQFRLNVK